MSLLNPQHNFKNILIVRTDRIGDVVLTTPSIKALRQTFPEAKISILLTPLTKVLLENNPDLDEVILDDRQRDRWGVFGFWRLVGDLRQRSFDCAIVYHTKRRTNLACYLAGIPYRVGYKNKKYGFLLNHPVEDDRHLGKEHEAQYCLNVLKSFQIDGNINDLSVSINEDATVYIDDLLKSNNIQRNETLITIHPGASDLAKMWPKENFAELIQAMIKKKVCRFVILGVKELAPIGDFLRKEVGDKVLDLTGLTDLAQLTALLHRTNLLISNDSGPVHIAAALQIPVVSLFTRNQPGINPERWKPLGEKSRYVAVLPENKNLFKKAQNYDPQTMEPLKLQEVLEAVDSIFKLC